MKDCPFCAEQIQDSAIKCRFCGEFLVEGQYYKTKTRVPWYYSTKTVVIALLVVGPFALPLIILNPRYKLITKILVTVAIIGLTVASYYYTKHIFQEVNAQLRELGY